MHTIIILVRVYVNILRWSAFPQRLHFISFLFAVVTASHFVYAFCFLRPPVYIYIYINYYVKNNLNRDGKMEMVSTMTEKLTCFGSPGATRSRWDCNTPNVIGYYEGDIYINIQISIVYISNVSAQYIFKFTIAPPPIHI